MLALSLLVRFIITKSLSLIFIVILSSSSSQLVLSGKIKPFVFLFLSLVSIFNGNNFAFTHDVDMMFFLCNVWSTYILHGQSSAQEHICCGAFLIFDIKGWGWGI